MATQEFQVTGMTCGHCERAVHDEVAKIPGVTDVTVSASDGRLVISAAEPVADQQVFDAVDEAGYEAVRVP